MAVHRGHRDPVSRVAATPDGRNVTLTGREGRTLPWDLELPAAPAPAPAELYWPGGRVTLCESGEYAVVVVGNDIIPC